MQPAPAFTAVAARHTLSRPSHALPPSSDPQQKPRTDWSDEVRMYVQRAFAEESAMPGIDNAALQAKLRVIITDASKANAMDSIDWSTYPLPQDFIKKERDEQAIYGRQEAILANINGTSLTTPTDGPSPTTSTHSRKRKSSDTDMTEADQHDNTPPWKKQTGKNGLQDRITGRSKTQEKQEKKKAAAMKSSALDVNPNVLAKRRERFGQVASPYLSSRDESPVPNGPVVGTCQKMEKKYFRLTAPPAPDTVRPLPVLEQALDLVRRKWKKEHNYEYAVDQLKSLRQDLTVQHIRNEFTVKVYEAHARIALEMADLSEYNQCQTQLRSLYKLNLGGNPEEFVAYRILYFIYARARTSMNDMLADLTTADKQKPAIKHALQVRSALASGNYHKFFRLYDEAPSMGPYLLDMLIERERFAAMAAICKAYKPDVSLQFLAQELAFHGDDESDGADADAGPRQCLDFICQHEASHLIEHKGGSVRLLTGKAGAHFENLRADAVRKVDIQGQK